MDNQSVICHINYPAKAVTKAQFLSFLRVHTQNQRHHMNFALAFLPKKIYNLFFQMKVLILGNIKALSVINHMDYIDRLHLPMTIKDKFRQIRQNLIITSVNKQFV